MDVDGCTIQSYYTTKDDAYARHHDFFLLHVYDDFKPNGPNTWTGTYGPYSVTVIQRGKHSDIREEDVSFERNPSFKEDPVITSHYVPSKEVIAKILNNHLNKIYGD
jgi:hypothetical protein